MHQFIVMNESQLEAAVSEPPQWNSAGYQSAEICGRASAAAYDALKAVNLLNH